MFNVNVLPLSTAYCGSLWASTKNRVEKFLQSSGFRLSTFISDIFGASGRNIILNSYKIHYISS
ncbi:MAG TPA: hypothetical protein DEQ64_20290 [Lachnoclostridium sp.]|nr:hypothetical protein [Lachnoclostridium sp.]